MTQEQKAKAYDEAIERAKVFKEHLLEINDKDYADEMDYIFPELAESEDEKMLKDTIRFCELCGNQVSANWLKSLKDRYTWKPSDEQMEALANALSLAKNCGEESAFDLRTLYEQLKKLKG